jgi:hypothetical protein
LASSWQADPLLTRPRLLAGAILFRPLSPFRDDLPAPPGWHLDPRTKIIAALSVMVPF